MNIITSQQKSTKNDLDSELSRLDQSIGNLDQLEKDVEFASNQEKSLKDELTRLNIELPPLKQSVEAKRDEMESLTNEDLRLSTSIGSALIEIDQKRAHNESRAEELNQREVNIDRLEKESREKIAKDEADLEQKRKALEVDIEKNKQKENSLNLLAARLEEYKTRLLMIGRKRNGGVEVPLQD